MNRASTITAATAALICAALAGATHAQASPPPFFGYTCHHVTLLAGNVGYGTGCAASTHDPARGKVPAGFHLNADNLSTTLYCTSTGYAETPTFVIGYTCA